MKQLAEEGNWWRWAAFGVFAATLLRIAWIGSGQGDLFPDEAQYWYWSLNPAWGYYSKPPLVAWLIWLTTHLVGSDDPVAVRLGAPLVHFGAALTIFALARRLYDARIAAWSALAYITLPGVSAGAIIISTDEPLLLCWAVALYAFVRARDPGEGRWWVMVGVALGLGFLAKYAMGFWLLSAALFLALRRDERRHLRRFLAAVALGLAIWLPNILWIIGHGFVTLHHHLDNAALAGSLLHPLQLAQFFGVQFLVFGPLLFAALLALFIVGRGFLADRRAALLATFAAPPLVLMLLLSLASRAHANWAAPAYVSATVLVVAWLAARGWLALVAASIALHVAGAILVLEARPIALSFGWDLPAKYDLIHRLRGWKRLGDAVSRELNALANTRLLADDREDMAELVYYVRPHPLDALKWNGDDGKVHDQFDLDAGGNPAPGGDYLLVSRRSDIDRIVSRFEKSGPIEHVFIPIGGGAARNYTMRLLVGFQGYR
jgi:4-amino-4-deoxy-L-arabinose transferase-like glycosyltransferase